ncbi:MAG: peptide chain release factor N(5)-glutamine methyltransferase [Burkholderiaceae bacterium]|nr:peptide chain release factor N(5)-glutamine methyltransferase [Burkholderiaceae bacterium]
MTTSSIQTLLHAAFQTGIDRLDAQLLMLHALGRAQSERAWLITHDDELLDAVTALAVTALCQRRTAGEPLAYIVGSKAFFGLDLWVDQRVLVPRPDTETLVEWALELALTGDKTSRVLDLGTGSGAIALALKHTRPDWQVTALDASLDALTLAQGNAQRLGLRIEFIQSSWFDALSKLTESEAGKFNLIVSNPPYIVEGDAHMADLKHEPKQALTSGADGLDDIRQIVQQAPHYLQPGGWLMLEHGYDQAAAVRGLLHQRGFTQVQSRLDLAQIERCSGGVWLG